MNLNFILAFGTLLIFSPANLQAQSEDNGAILLHPESGQPLCRIGEQVNQDFLPESLLDETGQLQNLPECSDGQILIVATENSSSSPLAIPLLISTGLGFSFSCLLAEDLDTQKEFVTSQGTPIHKGFLIAPKVLGMVGMGTLIYLFANKYKKLFMVSYLGSLVGGGFFCSNHPREDNGQ